MLYCHSLKLATHETAKYLTVIFLGDNPISIHVEQHKPAHSLCLLEGLPPSSGDVGHVSFVIGMVKYVPWQHMLPYTGLAMIASSRGSSSISLLSSSIQSRCWLDLIWSVAVVHAVYRFGMDCLHARVLSGSPYCVNCDVGLVSTGLGNTACSSCPPGNTLLPTPYLI